jgi:protein-disulfide isomerase
MGEKTEGKFGKLSLLIILGVVVGLAVISNQAKNPLLKEMLKQQEESLRIQREIEKKLSSSDPSGQGLPGLPGGGQFGQAQALEQRVAMLELQLRSLLGFLQQGQGGLTQPSAFPQAGQAQGQMVQGRPQPPVPPQGQPQMDLTTVHEIPVAHSPLMGSSKGAPVTIVEFIDFQCPFCSRFHFPMLEAIKAFPNKVNYMVKNFPLPFHPQAKPAAKAAFAAGEQGKYAQMVDALLQGGSTLSEETFKKLAGDLKLDVAKFWKDYTEKDAQWEKYIQDDMALGSRVGVRGTPSFYINGRNAMARDVEGWKKEIEQILSAKGGSAAGGQGKGR